MSMPGDATLMAQSALPSADAPKAQAVIEVRDLRVLFATHDRLQTVKAIDGVSFDVQAGETFGVIGESGSGKTTLGRALVSLVPPTSGTISRGGVDAAALSRADLRRHRRDYQIIFQDPHSALNPRLRIIDSVMEPLQIAGAGTRAENRRSALEALARVGFFAGDGRALPAPVVGWSEATREHCARAAAAAEADRLR